MSLERVARIVLLSALGFTAVTSVLGGVVLVIGSIADLGGSPLAIPDSYLEGSPFASTLVPGLALGLVVGGTQVAALVMVARRTRWAMAAAAVAGFGILVWIFVQMIFIPFSPLQAVYFVLGVVELGAVLVLLDVLHPWAHARTRRGGRDVTEPSTVP
ncbi:MULTISPECIES: hypothetical protein [unclassified Agromyces]|uniref:hypothetical protein n=1 Tax=unclassified Agromyces TaxID=2639701 RepID=UPI00301572AE